tara:strand:+ start:1982 stop:2788 length:807 start_codon:yes stop_codon:yes gene_type:complete
MKFKKKFVIENIKKNPKFSIITVVKNDQLNISNTIKSIISQSYKNFEYIIIDGKSTDKTLIKTLKFKKKINILITENDKGIYYAMNKAIKKAKGEIIVFVNSGDLLTKNALKYINHIFLKNKNFDFVFGTVKRHYITSTIIKYGVNRNRLKYNFDFATSHSAGFFLKSKIFKKYGLFNAQYKCSADYDLYHRLILKHKIVGGFTKKSNLVGIVKSGGYSSKINFLDHIFEETKIRLNNKQNFIFVLMIFCNALIKFVLKKIFNTGKKI